MTVDLVREVTTLGTDERRPTLIWNGYGEFVADLYTGLEKERLFV